MRKNPLPRSLTTAPFPVHRGTDAGATLNRLNAHDLDASVWGVRDWKRRDSLVVRCERYAARLGSHVSFSHSTAGLLYGIPLPLDLENSSTLHVSARAPARAPHAAGLSGHALAFGADERVFLGQFRVTSPERTWCDLASQVDLLNLVAAGDALLKDPRKFTSIDRMTECLARHPTLKNAKRASQALHLLDGAAESRPESMVRVIAVWGGLPRPKINHSLIDTEQGRIVRPDFEFEEYKTLVEYQGDYHRLTRAQWRKDMMRRARLQAAGWTVIEINADELRDPNALVELIAHSLRTHGWTGHTKRVLARITW
jgi:Protein of unknown function (DUF559)